MIPESSFSSDSRAWLFSLVALAVLVTLTTPAVFCRAALAGSERVRLDVLIRDAKKYDGGKVVVEGEIIGDRFERGDHFLITLNDDRYSKKSIPAGRRPAGEGNLGVGVWVLKSEAGEIGAPGNYSRQGPYVQIVGTFHRACREHGGDTDIHAESIEVLRPGWPIPHRLKYWKLFVAVTLLIVALVVLFLDRIGGSLRDVIFGKPT